MNRLMATVAALAATTTLRAATGVRNPVFDKQGNPTPLTSIFRPTPVAERIGKVGPAAMGELRVRPLFESCSIVWGAPEEVEGLALEYRADGETAWRKAPPIPYFPDFRNYRGSILRLKEATGYRFRLVAGGAVRAEGAFRTWSSAVKVAKTVVIDPAKAKWPMRIDAKGEPDGWIRYTAKGPIDVKGAALAFDVRGAAHVLLDDMVMRGGRGQHMISVSDSKGVRIRNCDISDWGRDGRPDYARKASWFDGDGRVIDYDCAIDIARGACETVVERCYVHDAHSRAVSWYYAHPKGPEAVNVAGPDHSTVLRWNDFVGSDLHPWNDAVEGPGNFDDDGGFNRDAEIYGNFMIYANDDSIELDGGQQNIRCFGNRFEAAGCGVSIQGCMVSPTYVYDNLFTGLGEEHHLVMQTIKTSSFDQFGNGSWAWIEGNTFWGPGTGVDVAPHFSNPLSRKTRWHVLDNRFSGPMQRLTGQKLTGERLVSRGNTFEEREMDETALDPTWPKRPLGFVLDRVRFTLAEPFAPVKVKALSRADRAMPFRVRVNRDFDWLKVSPSGGVVPARGECELTVSFDAARMKDRRRYRGAFLVQGEDGLSRPVSVWCTTSYRAPYHCEKPGETAVFAANAREGEFIEAGDEWRTYAFDLPHDGTWHFLIHGYNASIGELTVKTRHQLEVQVDDDEPAVSFQQVRNYPIWMLLMPGKAFGNFVCPFELKAGRHVVRIRRNPKSPRSSVLYDGVVATDACGSFEPR